MSSITALGIVLLGLMILVGGKQGWLAFLSLILNFGFLYFALLLIALQVPAIWVAAVLGVVMLAITIFMGEDDLNITIPAFLTACIVAFSLLLIIYGIEHLEMVQGFSLEDSDDLEGMSLALGVSFLNVTIATAFLSTLGAIAEAAMAVAAGLTEILSNHPKLPNVRLFHNGMMIGKQIIGTTLNTLFFGFVGGLLALLIWFLGLHYSLGTILNNKIFVHEATLVLISFLAVILTVPVTALVVIYRRNHLKNNLTRTE
ncbi:YibE/F family protein [Lactobacillus alvi]|uniref:YibE/F family protein n=1 Tax=Limosilactobacillus alvi TaxID=990412 RepID=A0ABS2EPU4_9LACO|nr:YibE/F family protein [Limosilactobacillus alvi]